LPRPALREEQLEELAPVKVAKPSLLDESNVPTPLRDQVLDELSKGEKLVWIGQPRPRNMVLRALPIVLVGLILTLVCAGLTITSLARPGKQGGGVRAALMTTMPMLVGIGIVLGTPIYQMWRAQRTVYALTNRRALVWFCQWHGGISPTTYTPAQIANMFRRDYWFLGQGAGDLVFHTVTKITVRTGSRGVGGVSTSKTHFGFLAIDRVRDVEKLVRETLTDRLMDKLVN
jgi:hypothetical protein